MRFKCWALGVILLLSFSLTSVSTQNQAVPTAGQEAKDLMAVIGKVPPTIKREALASLADQIKRDNAFLSTRFEARDFEAMAKLYDERHGVISTRNYQIIYGKDSEPFWGKVWGQGKTLEFKLVSVYVSGLPGPPKEDFDAVTFVTAEIHVVQKTKEGSVMSNESYYQNLALRHSGKCPWY